MGAGQHQHWAASGKQPAASWGKWLVAGGQQGGDVACLLIGHGRCCLVVLLSRQSLTEGICGDVLDAVEGIASEIVIRHKNVYLRGNQEYVTDQNIRCAERHCR
jgi:hypothetical protein